MALQALRLQGQQHVGRAGACPGFLVACAAWHQAMLPMAELGMRIPRSGKVRLLVLGEAGRKAAFALVDVAVPTPSWSIKEEPLNLGCLVIHPAGEFDGNQPSSLPTR